MVHHGDELRERAVALYDSGLSSRDVTAKLMAERGTYVSPQTIARWARAEGKNRPVGATREIDLPAEARRFYESGLNLEQVARRFHVGKTVVAARLREMGTGIRPSGSLFGPVLTEERLREMYITKGMGAHEIAKVVGCETGTVYNWLRLRGVPLRRKRTRNAGRNPRSKRSRTSRS